MNKCMREQLVRRVYGGRYTQLPPSTTTVWIIFTKQKYKIFICLYKDGMEMQLHCMIMPKPTTNYCSFSTIQRWATLSFIISLILNKKLFTPFLHGVGPFSWTKGLAYKYIWITVYSSFQNFSQPCFTIQLNCVPFLFRIFRLFILDFVRSYPVKSYLAAVWERVI